MGESLKKKIRHSDVEKRIAGLNLQSGALAASSLAIFIAASLTVFAEAQIFLVSRLDQSARLEALQGGVVRDGPSTYSKRLYLDDCLAALTSVRGRTLRPANRAMLGASCRDGALKIVETNPTNGFAYYIAALASAVLGDWNSFNARLADSREVSPGEEWLSELRVKLADERKELLDSDGETALDRDVATLAQSGRGIRVLAHKAVVDEVFRERVVSVLKNLTEEDKRAFLNAYRSALRGRR